MKQNERLKERLESAEFKVRAECAVSLLQTKLDIINIELSTALNRNVIQLRSGRLKSYGSTCKKLDKKGLKRSFSVAVNELNDLIGVRAICAYVDDIYRVAEILEQQEDIRIFKKKDYIENPKKSGYQSLHLIMEIPIAFHDGTQWMKTELQLRTAAMDYWATLDHQLRYKRGKKGAELIDEELHSCAESVWELDRKMMEIRTRIDRI